MSDVIQVRGLDVPVGSHEGRFVVVGADHRGFAYKERVKEWLGDNGYRFTDVGTYSLDRCDYPTFSSEIGRLVSADHLNTVGMGICGSGIGIIIPAFNYRGVYGATCLNPEMAETSRKHNNTNLLGIGADHMDEWTMLETVTSWLDTPFYSDPETEQVYLDRYLQTIRHDTREQGKLI
ncbi:MAG: RpiB/LacA/LacB family sugar-phosphate isomerase [Candidatus Aenigmarchaeota archaeon]|nr:RpiB/LacA/LacB family sugar-phosphate isomerase [Candidatus Aenigmarchaeota archaeon]